MTDMKLVPDVFAEDVPKKPSRDGFGKGLLELAEKDSSIWALSADVSESTRTHWFAEKFPDRFVQVGVAEQNLAGVAAGIASCGKKAFISAFAAFSPAATSIRSVSLSATAISMSRYMLPTQASA